MLDGTGGHGPSKMCFFSQLCAAWMMARNVVTVVYYICYLCVSERWLRHESRYLEFWDHCTGAGHRFCSIRQIPSHEGVLSLKMGVTACSDGCGP